MHFNSVKMIYFSPTGTTRTVLEAVREAFGTVPAEHIDLTRPDGAARHLMDIHDALAIIGAPVYAGRLPAEMVVRFRRMKGNGSPAVILVVYGNRAYDDALLELKDLVLEAGFKPIAAAAFIGEHSFSTDAAPIAVGRPDADDLRTAGKFGKTVREKLLKFQSFDEISLVHVPGKFPYKPGSALSGISPVTRRSECSKCEECAAACPVGAIAVKETVLTDSTACIRCCACIKRCSTGARVMEDPRLRQIAEQLSINCRQRKEPETYW